MARSAIMKSIRLAGRALESTSMASRTPLVRPRIAAAVFSHSTGALAPVQTSVAAHRPISTSPQRKEGITPDGKPVMPKEEEPAKVITPAEITEEAYHKVADEYMDRLLGHLEQLQDAREDVDVEYSAGVLTVNFGPDTGTYVINKQPPNKQIWLSSPKSGPKRYDYVVIGDGQQEKQDTACGEWMYLRDNSTINQLLVKELGIDLRMPVGSYGE